MKAYFPLKLAAQSSRKILHEGLFSTQTRDLDDVVLNSNQRHYGD